MPNTSVDLLDTHLATLEWPFISHSRRISFIIVLGLSDVFPRRLCLLSQADIPTPSQCEQFRSRATTDPSKSGVYTYGDARVLVCESDIEFSIRRVRDLGARMDPQIPAPDAATVQSTSTCTHSSVLYARRVAGGPPAHGTHSAHIPASLHPFVPLWTHRDDLWR